jgi:PAS domain S-box-containing protein
MSPASSASSRTLSVLIVEDSEFDARILVNLLRQGGYLPEWRRVDSGPALLTALDSGNWDVILCDHSMPGFSAPEALKLVQGTGKDIPFLIVSGGIGEDVAVAAMKSGAHDFLIKGSLARLVPAVERELREAATRAARRTAENSLRESELRYRLVWENSADAVLLIGGDGLIRFANPAVAAIFGWEPHELIGRPLATLQPADPGSVSWLEAARQGARQRIVDAAGLRRDGSPVDLDIAFSDLRLDEQPLFAAFIRDITERKRTMLELQKNREEFAAAREIQQRLFPKSAPEIAGFEVAGASYPAEAAGGDYYDFLPLAQGTLGLVIADVSGHGVGPSLLMAEARAYLRLLARSDDGPAGLLTRANAALAEDLGGGNYITMLLARIDPSSRTLSYASAGHPPGFVIGADGAVLAELRRTGPPLGQRSGFSFGEGPPLHLNSGDLLVFLTDGIAESMRGNECFGRERTLAVAREHRNEPATAIVDALCGSARNFSGSAPQADDLTVVVAKAL